MELFKIKGLPRTLTTYVCVLAFNDDCVNYTENAVSDVTCELSFAVETASKREKYVQKIKAGEKLLIILILKP